MKSSSYIDLQRFMLIPTKFPLTRFNPRRLTIKHKNAKACPLVRISERHTVSRKQPIVKHYHASGES